MQTRSQTKQSLICSPRTRNQTKLQQLLQVASPPRLIRSPTKKTKKASVAGGKKDDGNGVYIYTGLSATGEGMHIRWEYPLDERPFEKPASTLPAHMPSYSSLFEGTLSSISSGESSFSSGSFSSVQLGPRNDVSYPQTSDWESGHNITTLPHSSTASQPARRSPRPLQRAVAHRWENSAGSSTNDHVSNATSVFSQQLAKLADQRKVLANVKTEFEADFKDDTASIAETEIDLQSHLSDSDQHELNSNGSLTGLAAQLGPCGTVLIEEAHNAPSNRTMDYPSTWASRQSTHLTVFPTEQNFGMEE